jgi:hypothetical protein
MGGVTIAEIAYRPRPQQKAIHAGIDAHRFSTIVCHRRFGKSVMGINHLQKGALTCKLPRPRYAYIGPTYRQAKQTIWDYAQHYSSTIPGVEKNQAELRVDYPNGGRVQLHGADNPDSLRGSYWDGVVLDEYGLMASNVFTEVIRPALSDRGGWAVFLGTPNGHNQFYEAYQHAKGDPSWFCAVYKASETGILSAAELTDARKVMTDDEYRQEFECSFEAAIKGSIYGKELEKAKVDGRITRIPYEPLLPVDTDWDLGVGDATAIWFSQTLTSGEVRLIDYVEASGEGLPYYVNLLQSKGYSYGDHWAPHDIQVREFSSGRSRFDTAKGLGIHFKVSPRIPIEDGIHAGRMLFPRCYFDEVKCAAGLEALQHYRRDYNSRLNEFKSTPIHDVFSHAADAFRGLATRPGRKKVVPLQAPSLPMAASGPLSWMDA